MDAVTLTAAGLDYVQKKLEALNKRADKCGLPRVQLHSEEQLWPVWFNKNANQERASLAVPGVGPWEQTGRFETRYAVTVSGPAPVLAGYRVVARIDHLTEGNIINKAPDVGELPAYWRHVPATCSHCLQTRRRNSTFLLQNVELDPGSNYFQVGRNCLADYCRDEHAAEAIVSWGAIIDSLDRTIREASGLSGGGEKLYSVEALTRAAILCADTFGWVSVAESKDDWGKVPTRNRVLDALNPARKDEDYRLAGIREQLAEGHRETEAKAVVAWITTDVANRDENTINDYLANLVVAFRQEAVSQRYAGLVCSAFRAHRRESAEQDEAARKAATAEALPPQKWIGTEGERVRNLHVRCVFIKSLGMSEYNGRVSERFLCKFETIPDGDTITWFTGENLKYKEGEEAFIDASVKKHDTYNDRKSTIVQRVSDSKLEKPSKTPRKPRAKKENPA